MLIQCISAISHLLSNQTLCRSSVALQIADALPDKYQQCFSRVLASRAFSFEARNNITPYFCDWLFLNFCYSIISYLE